MQPSKYPIEALYYVGRQPDVLQFLISTSRPAIDACSVLLSILVTSCCLKDPLMTLDCAVVGLFFKEFLVPIFWIFKSLVQKDHRLVFQFVLKQHGISPDQVKFKSG